MEQDSLSIYFEQIKKIPLLSAEKEAELLGKAAAGSKRAKNKIVEANLRFVVKIAKEYTGRGLDLEDLISEGNAGLMQAVDKFNPEAGVKFISYAVWWIRQSISKAVYEFGHQIRLPLNRANDLVHIERVLRSVSSKNESEQVSIISEKLKMKPEIVRALMDVRRESVSLEAPVGTGEDGAMSPLVELLEDSRSKDPETLALENSLKSDVADALSTLTPKEKKIVRLRYGFDSGKAMSLKEVGDEVGLTKERVRQIEKGVLSAIRSPARSSRLLAYVA